MGRRPLVHCCHLLSTRAPCLDHEAPRPGSLHAFHDVPLNHGELWEALSGPSPVFLNSCLLSTAPSKQENSARLVPSKARTLYCPWISQSHQELHHPHNSSALSGGLGDAKGRAQGSSDLEIILTLLLFLSSLCSTSPLSFASCSPIPSRKHYLVREECVQEKQTKQNKNDFDQSHLYASKLFFCFYKYNLKNLTLVLWLCAMFQVLLYKYWVI